MKRAPLHNGEVFRYKRKLYAIGDNIDNLVTIIRAKILPANKKLVEAIYLIEVGVAIEDVKELSRSGEIEKYKMGSSEAGGLLHELGFRKVEK